MHLQRVALLHHHHLTSFMWCFALTRMLTRMARQTEPADPIAPSVVNKSTSISGILFIANDARPHLRVFITVVFIGLVILWFLCVAIIIACHYSRSAVKLLSVFYQSWKRSLLGIIFFGENITKIPLQLSQTQITAVWLYENLLLQEGRHGKHASVHISSRSFD